MRTEFKFEGKPVVFDLKPGTLYRLAKAGYSFPESFGKSDTALLATTELLRICSKTDLTSEEVADRIDDYEPLMQVMADLFESEEAKLKAKDEDEPGNG